MHHRTGGHAAHASCSRGYRPDLEMNCDKAHDQALEILCQIIEYFEACWIFTVLDIERRSNFPAREGDVFIPNFNFQFLSFFPRWFLPMRIVDRRYFRLSYDAFDFFHNSGAQMDLASDHFTSFVIRIVGIAQFATRRQFKFHEFMTKPALVTDVITNVKVVVGRLHGHGRFVRFPQYQRHATHTHTHTKTVCNGRPEITEQ